MVYRTELDRKFLRAALHFAGVRDIRANLNGVHVELYPERSFIVATDGHRLGVFRESGADVPSDGVSFTIPHEYVAYAFRFQPNVSCIGVEFDDAARTVTMTDSGVVTTCIEGAFPDWRRVLSLAKPNGVAAHFDPRYVADFVKVAKALGVWPTAVHIGHAGETSALLWIDGVPGFRGVLMPMRMVKFPAMPGLEGFADRRDKAAASEEVFA